MHVIEIQQRIGRGEYQVDAHAVATAILRRLLAERRFGECELPPQEECS